MERAGKEQKQSQERLEELEIERMSESPMPWDAARERFLRCFSERTLHVLEASAIE